MGFIANLLGGGGDNFQAQKAQVANNDYASAIQKLMGGGALNPVDFNQSNQTAGQQQQLANILLNTAQGNGPSVAQNQLNNTTNQNIAQGSGMIASQKGLNPALAARLILNNTAQANQNAAGQGALLRSQETLGAQNALSGLLGQQRGQDISQSLGQVQSGINQVGSLGQLQNSQNLANIQNQQGADAINQKSQEANAQRGQGLFGGLLSGVGALSGLGAVGKAAGAVGGALGASSGGVIPGKEEYSGDSPKNDTVPTMLSPGEIVVPKSAAKSPEKAKEFIDALMKSKYSGAESEPHFGHVIAAQRGLHDRLSMLERMCYGGMS